MKLNDVRRLLLFELGRLLAITLNVITSDIAFFVRLIKLYFFKGKTYLR